MPDDPYIKSLFYKIKALNPLHTMFNVTINRMYII